MWGRVWGVGLIALVFLGGVVVGKGPGSRVVQPIRFNHAKHTGAGLDCVICHTSVKEQAFASLPTVETCMLCHSNALTESPEEEKIREFAAGGQVIPWQRLYRLPNNVLYSHRRHAGVAGIECQRCHGPIGEAESPPARPLVRQTMEWCLECHVERGVTTDCAACHR
ncbi:MAG: cytochrome c3 family protein [Gemmatimonadetes bacterium]|nr:cytochrome c3 family protein [Gemmatimonadota bacterium]